MTIPFIFRWLAPIAALVTFAGCATTYVKPTTMANPPPSEAWSAFRHFEVKPITMGAPYAGQEANEAALKKIQQNFSLRVDPIVAGWNSKSGGAEGGRTLVLEPRIVDVKFVNATARVWAGAMAGSSAVVMKIRFVEKETGKEIADPEFYQRAAAMGGAWSFGATDNNMLVRITEVATQYIQANYDRAVGGPTGAEELPK